MTDFGTYVVNWMAAWEIALFVGSLPVLAAIWYAKRLIFD